jgi:hypothetical protein
MWYSVFSDGVQGGSAVIPTAGLCIGTQTHRPMINGGEDVMKRRILSLLLAVVMLLTVLPYLPIEADAHKIVMTAEEFIDCLWVAYSRPNYYYNSFPYNLGYYDGSRISFDCWNLGKAIIWTKGEIVNNYTAGAYAKMDTSCGLGDWDG